MAWMGARPLSKRIADEVAAEWDDAWRCFALDAESRLAFADEALAKAQGILSIVIESYPEVLGDLTTVLALTVLQELGEGYALMSEAWPIGREANPWMPDLAVVERNVRLTTVDSPSGQLSEIELTTPVSGGDGRDSSQPSRIVPVTEHKLAHDLAKAFSTYPTFLAVVAADRGRIELYKRRTETRRTACMGMSLLRREFDLLGALVDRGGAARQAVYLYLLLTDSRFLATAGDSIDQYRQPPVVLPIDFVRGYIRDTDVGAWLANHGAQLSDELG